MRFNSINIYSDEDLDGDRKKEITGMLRRDSDKVVDRYLNLLKYYNNDNCKSLNIACNEIIDEPYIQPFVDGYPILHYPFDISYYKTIDNNDLYIFWLDLINDAVKYVSEKWLWDYEFFEDIYNKMLSEK